MKPTLWVVTILAGLVPQTGTTLAGPTPAAGPAIALVSKAILDVQRREVGKDWLAAKRGETLSSGDMVKTGERSLAIVKFKDNSLLRVREKTVLTVTGSVSGSAFSKSVDLQNGTIGFNIKKQLTGEEFRFTSPTSVASVRGTTGRLKSRETADTLTVTEGKVRLKNKVSSTEVDVESGYTGVSNSDGTVSTHPSTATEQSEATNALRESDQDNRLELEFRDNQGNRKQLKIDFK